MTDEPEELDRVGKVLLHVLGTMQGLIEKGLVACTDDTPSLTAKGMMAYRRLRESGFEPTAEELVYAVQLFKADPPGGEPTP